MDRRTRDLEREFRAHPTLQLAHELHAALARFMGTVDANLYLDAILRELCCPNPENERMFRRRGAIALLPGAYYGDMLLRLVPQSLRTAGTVLDFAQTYVQTTYRLDREGPGVEERLVGSAARGPKVRLDLPDGSGRPQDWSHSNEELTRDGIRMRCASLAILPGDVWTCRGHTSHGVMLSFTPSFKRNSTTTNGGGTIECEPPAYFAARTLESRRLPPGHTERQFVLAAADLYHWGMRVAITRGPSWTVSTALNRLVRSYGQHGQHGNTTVQYTELMNRARRLGLPQPPYMWNDPMLTPEQAGAWMAFLMEESQ